MTVAPLHQITVTGRPRLQQDLGRCARAARGPNSFAVVGLPGFCPERALDAVLAGPGQQPGLLLHRLRIGSRSPAEIAATLATALGASPGPAAGPVPELLGRWREAGEALADRRLLLVVEDFHRLVELRRTCEKDVLDLLDCWQAACTESQWLRVAVCSRLTPARVCANAGWSEFYKVFGVHIYRAGLLEPGWEATAAELLAARGVAVSAGVLAELSRVSGGVPDFVVELLKYLETEPVEEGGLERLACRSDFFADHRRKMLDWLPPEARDVLEGGGWHEVTPQTRQWAQECRTLGLLVERDGSLELPTPLLVPSVPEEAATGTTTAFLHYEHLVGPELRPLVRRLCADTHYTRLRTIQNLPGEAHVLHLTRENKDGRKLPPRIVKIWKTDRLRIERANHVRAQELLGPSCPQALAFEEKGAHAALLIQYACADNRNYEVRTFQDLYQAHRDGPPEDGHPLPDPDEVVERLLDRVLAGLYRGGSLKPLTLAGCYYPPAVKKAQDELALLTELARQNGRLVDGTGEMDFGAGGRVADPGELLRRHRKALFEVKAPRLVCDPVHGDLNVRNFLIDGAGNIHVIDFSSLREGPLLKDFTRLECEVLLKLTPVGDLAEHVGLLRRLLAPGLVEQAQALSREHDRGALGITLRVVAAIRRISHKFAEETAPGPEYRYEADYLGGLAATAGRVALFTDYLEGDQVVAALAYTGLACSRLLEAQVA